MQQNLNREELRTLRRRRRIQRVVRLRSDAHHLCNPWTKEKPTDPVAERQR